VNQPEPVAGIATDPETLRRRIEQTRDDLAETVEALAAKTDVKARASHAALDAAGTVTGEIRAAERAVATRYRDVASLVRRTARRVGASPRRAGVILAGAAALLVALAVRRRR
jgi:hypothetical protein